MPIFEEVGMDQTNEESRFLNKFRRIVNSQVGEDGIIEKICELIGTKNKWCVEFGAWDGRHLSNTCHLIENMGWTGVQIEGSKRKFEELVKNFASFDNAISLNRLVGFEQGVDSLDDVLSETDIPVDFDFLSIDIDGNDYHVWDSLQKYKPRIIAIEFNPKVPNRVIFVQDRDMNIQQGCSAAALVELGKQKGYELVCVVGVNCIFVTAEDFPKIGLKDNRLSSMRVDKKGSIFAGYDGTIFNNLHRLGWQHREVYVEIDELQVLEKGDRKFEDRVTD